MGWAFVFRESEEPPEKNTVEAALLTLTAAVDAPPGLEGEEGQPLSKPLPALLAIHTGRAGGLQAGRNFFVCVCVCVCFSVFGIPCPVGEVTRRTADGYASIPLVFAMLSAKRSGQEVLSHTPIIATPIRVVRRAAAGVAIGGYN